MLLGLFRVGDFLFLVGHARVAEVIHAGDGGEQLSAPGNPDSGTPIAPGSEGIAVANPSESSPCPRASIRVAVDSSSRGSATGGELPNGEGVVPLFDS